MSELLKRTKKSCLKIFRKISTSKQLFAKKADDDSTDNKTNNNNNNSNSNSNNNSISNIQNNNNKSTHGSQRDYAIEMETSPMSRKKVNHNYTHSTESLPSTRNHHEHHHQQHLQRNNATSPKEKHFNHLYNSNNNNNNQACVHKDIEDLLEDESPNNTILHKLTARLFLTADGYDFQRLQQLRSDTGSEVVQFDMESLQDNIVFEKVNYKNDVRYLRHTPSNSSLDNFHANRVATTPDYHNDDNDNGDFDLDNDWQVNEDCNQFTNFGFQTSTNINAFRPTINMCLGSKLNGNLQNVVISEERNNENKLTPIVKWDINGNSLDDDDDLLPHEYLEDFDKRLSKRIAALKQLQLNKHDNESEDSSLHSSSTTLETWVDEDLLPENSKDNRCLIKN